MTTVLFWKVFIVGLNVGKIGFFGKSRFTSRNGIEWISALPAAIKQAEQIARAVDAFIRIRHGHGEQTVDKYGFPG